MPDPDPRMPPEAAVAWGEDGILRSTVFGDVYASRDGALEETRRVFLAACGLPQRWRLRRGFTIGELGFGTGLNALAAWDLWRKTRAPSAVLHFISIEGFPLPKAEAARALALFGEVSELADKLLARWPVRAYGAQRVVWDEDGFILTVVHGPVEAGLKAFDAPVDAWFLDGFAPARNPEMWTETILRRLKTLSAPGARAATYSAAGAVRRGLQEAGFIVEKAPGFGSKRDRLIAQNPGETGPDAPLPTVAVVGGGIAGACIAHALARRGASASLWTAGDALADQASGNPAGLVMPRLDRGASPAAAFLRAAYLFAWDHYREVASEAFTRCGVRQRPDSLRAAEAFADLLADPPWPQDHLQAGEDGALVHVQAGMLAPKVAIAALTKGLEVRLGSPVRALTRVHGRWRLEGEGGGPLCEADAVVIATGASLQAFPETRWLPIALSQGQIEFGDSLQPPQALTQGAYVGPCGAGLVFGATFAATHEVVAPATTEARAENLARLAALDPELAARLDLARLQSRAAVRATTADRLPILGPAPNAAAWRLTDQHNSGPRHDGLWLFGGLGARGLTLAPLLAESLASRLCVEPDPIAADQRVVLDPARFILRALKRGETLPA
jgi:tRNA 5-methylaminomethyl-2-thiouridine biosynthesis bifunctional protein